jgi:hypothetical protein
MSTTTPLRLVPLRAWKALAALQEPLPQAQLNRRLDKALAALCQALAAPLPEASGLLRYEAATLPDAESFAHYAKKLDGLRFHSAYVRVEEANRLLTRLQGMLEDTRFTLASSGLSEQDCRELDDATLAYLREHEPFTWLVAQAWEWLAAVNAATEAVAKVAKRAAENAGNLPRGDKRPENTSRLEKLYHATLYADDLLQKGFASEKPLERTGIGNLGAQATVSFTHSRNYAQRLNRFFQFAWQLAHGEVTLQRALALMGRNVSFEQRPATAPRHQQQASFYDADKRGTRTDHARRDVEKFLHAYSTSIEYLAVCDAGKLWENLRKVDRKSLAVVECLVDTEGAEYLAGELEFRVTPDKVVKVLRRVTS